MSPDERIERAAARTIIARTALTNAVIYTDAGGSLPLDELERLDVAYRDAADAELFARLSAPARPEAAERLHSTAASAAQGTETEMGTIRIMNRWDSSKVIFETEAESVREAVEKACKARASLDGANLYGANLYGANLDGANLDGANLDGASLVRASLVGASLDGANLVRANLVGASLVRASLDGASLVRANLYGASLDGANLVRANLDGASLDGASLDGASLVRASLDGASLVRANLYGASLVRANLDGANLDGASLDGANLDGANLDGASLVRASLDAIKDDFYKVLAAAPKEALGLLRELRAGNIDGSTYSGECACLVGTIGKLRGVESQKRGCMPDLRGDGSRPAERWFLALAPGHTPRNHPVAKIAEQWAVEWLKKRGIDARPKVIVETVTLWRPRGVNRGGFDEKAAAKLCWPGTRLVRVTRRVYAAPPAE